MGTRTSCKKCLELFSAKGREEITLNDAPKGVEVIEKIESKSSIREVLNMTYDNFAIYTVWQLRNMTHEIGTPWYKTYVKDKNKEITLDLIKIYFDEEVME